MVLVVAGCCRSGGSTHACNFTPVDQMDGGESDGPLPCGTEICEGGKVCCFKKVPATAFCIPPSEFEAQGCEKLKLPCNRPSDCPGGAAVSCCVVITGDTGTVTCLPNDACRVAGGYMACENDTQCPATRPACMQVSETPTGEPFSVCR